MELQPHNLVLHRRCRRRAAAHGRPRLGPLRRPLTQTGDSSTTAAGNTVGDTTYIDEHGLQVQVNWTHYNNGSRGFGGSREWAVQLRFSSVNASGCAAANNQPISLPVCGPGDFFGAPAPPPPGPPPPCPALQNVTLNQGISGQDLTNCGATNPPPVNTSIDPAGCSSTSPAWAANATRGFEECAAACCRNARCAGMIYQQVGRRGTASGTAVFVCAGDCAVCCDHDHDRDCVTV